MGLFKSIVDFFVMSTCKSCAKDYDTVKEQGIYVTEVFRLIKNQNFKYYSGEEVFYAIFPNGIKGITEAIIKTELGTKDRHFKRAVDYKDNIQFIDICPRCWNKANDIIKKLKISDCQESKKIHHNLKGIMDMIESEDFDYLLDRRIIYDLFIDEKINVYFHHLKWDKDRLKTVAKLYIENDCDERTIPSYNIFADDVDVLSKAVISEKHWVDVEKTIEQLKIKYKKSMMNKGNIKLYNMNYGKDFSYLGGEIFKLNCSHMNRIQIYDRVKFFTSFNGYDMVYNVFYNANYVTGVMSNFKKR